MHKENLQNAPQARGCYPLRETLTAAHSLSTLLRLPVNGAEGELAALQPLRADGAGCSPAREVAMAPRAREEWNSHSICAASMRAHPTEWIQTYQLVFST